MTTVILFAALSANCPVIKVVTPYEYALTLADIRQMEHSANECKKRYEDNPCMKQLHIIDSNRYAVKCGKVNDGENNE